VILFREDAREFDAQGLDEDGIDLLGRELRRVEEGHEFRLRVLESGEETDRPAHRSDADRNSQRQAQKRAAAFFCDDVG